MPAASAKWTTPARRCFSTWASAAFRCACASAPAVVKFSSGLKARCLYMTPVPRSTSAVAGASAAGSTTTHTTGGRTSRSVCASRSSSALRRRRSPAPDRVVVTTISSRRGPVSSSSSPTSTIAPSPPAPTSPAASGGGGTRLRRVLTATREAASWSPARCVSCWVPAFQDEVEEGAKPVKNPMTKQSEKWSSAFFHR
uniref:Uncharacterized protein n=1 Tax=Arundo donax TaxID=35708 RepID=A0A0A9E1Z9_ARUDO